MNKSKVATSIQLAPLRSLKDFLTESARFQIPNVQDIEKWGNRVVSNLLYYQTNYFLMSIVLFLIVGILHPVQMLCGLLVTCVAVLVFGYLTSEKRAASRFKKNHPILSILLVLSSAYLITYALGSLVVFLVGILLPISAIFIHASLRMRNMKNKFTNKMEELGLKQTPMGIFLEDLGIEQEIFS